MNAKCIVGIVAAVAFASTSARAQNEPNFEKAGGEIQQRLEKSIAELEALRQQLVDEKIPLNKEFNDLQAELARVREDFTDASRSLTASTLSVANLEDDIVKGNDRLTYLSGLLSEYVRKLETRLHVADKQRYKPQLSAAKLAAQNDTLSAGEVFDAQLGLVSTSLDRLFDALGGTTFEGSAVNQTTGLIDQGKFLLYGPTGLFLSENGKSVGIVAPERSTQSEPTSLPFTKPEDAQAAIDVVSNRVGDFPLDTTLGNAHKIEGMQESTWEHIQKGGSVMWPIGILAGIAMLIAIYKWITLSMIRKPSKKQMATILDMISRRDYQTAKQRAHALKGPAAEMLATGLDHSDEPRELVEEVMYEKILKARLKTGSMLPFIAICAAAAPLLGLLGTVIGIIDTFKLITEFGSGDVQMLSAGISVALITTKFGLIVAIPSLLLHAYLARKARGIVGDMEQVAIALVNQMAKTPLKSVAKGAAPADRSKSATDAVDPGVLREQVNEILSEMLGPLRGHLEAGGGDSNGNHEAQQVVG